MPATRFLKAHERAQARLLFVCLSCRYVRHARHKLGDFHIFLERRGVLASLLQATNDEACVVETGELKFSLNTDLSFFIWAEIHCVCIDRVDDGFLQNSCS